MTNEEIIWYVRKPVKHIKILNTIFTLQEWPTDWVWLNKEPLIPCSIKVITWR